jgi:hypothetical protein
MSERQFTLQHFFFHSDEDIVHKFKNIESEDAILQLKDKIAKEVRGADWLGIFSNIADNVKSLFDINVSTLMSTAWNKYRFLLKYLDREKYPPDQTFLVSLAEHTIKSEYRPCIEIYVDQQLFRKVKFLITILITFEGLTLKIRDGRILEIRTGTCMGKGSFSCENCLILERKTAPFQLPGIIDLGDGVPIAA